MKKSKSVVETSLALALTMCAAEPSPSFGFSVCAVGDSITQGSDKSVAHRVALERRFNEVGWNVEWKGTRRNPSWGSTEPCEGYGGKNAEAVANSYASHAAAVTADLLLLHAGHNYNADRSLATPAYRSVTDIVAAATNAHAQIIAEARRQNPKVVVLYAKVITSGKLPKYSYIPALNRAIDVLAGRMCSAESPVVAVDMADGWNYATDCVPDKVHPNAVGADKMAAKWMGAIRKLVESGRLTVADATGIKAQIAAERKGDSKVFEEALSATVAKTWKSPDGGTLPYRLHIPAKPEVGRLYPLVVHMHGAGSWGTNNLDQIKTGGADFIAWAKKRGEEYVFIAPQTPRRRKWVDTPWENTSSTMKGNPTPSLRMALEIVDDAIARYPVDRDRIYVMGISMGGYATWELLQRRPELFAAGLPCCGGGDVAQAPRLKNIAIWAFHGDKDKGVPVCRSRDMVAAIKAAGGKKILYREYKGRGHNVWTPTFSDDKVFEWLFSQRRHRAECE